MKFVKIDAVKSGDVLAMPIITSEGVSLLSEGSVLSREYIEKIKQSGIKNLYIYEIAKIKDKTVGEFSLIKEHGIDVVSNIYHKVINYETIDMEEITPVVYDILNLVKNKNNFPFQILQQIKLKDDLTYIHCVNTCFLAVMLGEHISLNEKDIITLGIGALLHDIGKIKIDSAILNKTAKLTNKEFDVIKKHTTYGYEILKNANADYNTCALIALNHHEKYDGSGYPRALKGVQIDLLSGIVSVCDVYDALINIRSYKKALKPNEAFDFILSKTGFYFSLDIVKAFRDCILIYPDGMGIKLSDKRLGFVVRQNKGFPERPVVNIITDQLGRFTEPYEIDLMKNLNVVINDIII